MINRDPMTKTRTYPQLPSACHKALVRHSPGAENQPDKGTGAFRHTRNRYTFTGCFVRER